MIFGFNTDVKFAETVYHVQSEARQHQLLLETLVFVKGRCIGKHATSYAERMQDPDFSEEHMHEMLKNQHRHFVAAVREGRIEAELGEHIEPAHVEPAHVEPAHVEPAHVEPAHVEPTHAEPPAAVAHAASDETTAIFEAYVAPPAPPEFPVIGYPAPPQHVSAAAPMVEPEPMPPVQASAPAPIIEPEPVPADQAASPPAPIIEPEPVSPAPPAYADTVELAAAPAPPTCAETIAMSEFARRVAAARKLPDSGFTLNPAGKLIGKGLSLECLRLQATGDGSALTISVQIGEESGPAAGAQITCRITSGKARAQYLYATSSDAGIADVRLLLKDLDLTATALLIQASHRGNSASRKYKLQPSS